MTASLNPSVQQPRRSARSFDEHAETNSPLLVGVAADFLVMGLLDRGSSVDRDEVTSVVKRFASS